MEAWAAGVVDVVHGIGVVDVRGARFELGESYGGENARGIGVKLAEFHGGKEVFGIEYSGWW